jgi:hypothetical protein
LNDTLCITVRGVWFCAVITVLSAVEHADYLTFWHAIVIDLGSLLVVVLNGARVLRVQTFPRPAPLPTATPVQAEAKETTAGAGGAGADAGLLSESV